MTDCHGQEDLEWLCVSVASGAPSDFGAGKHHRQLVNTPSKCNSSASGLSTFAAHRVFSFHGL